MAMTYHYYLCNIVCMSPRHLSVFNIVRYITIKINVYTLKFIIRLSFLTEVHQHRVTTIIMLSVKL